MMQCSNFSLAENAGLGVAGVGSGPPWPRKCRISLMETDQATVVRPVSARCPIL
jgi:hypothetical protein